MDDVRTPRQRIERLTPLADLLAVIDAQVMPIAPKDIDLTSAVGRVLADDIRADRRPAMALALRDGYAVRSEETADAGSYAPAPLSLAVRVEVGEPIPPGADAVAPPDAVAEDGQTPQALPPIAPGDGVLMPGQDCDNGEPVLRAGQALQSIDVAVLAALGVTRVAVRTPTACIVQPRPDDGVASAITSMLADLVSCHWEATISLDGAEAALLGAQQADAMISLAEAAWGGKTPACARSPVRGVSWRMASGSPRERPARLDLSTTSQSSSSPAGSMQRWRFGTCSARVSWPACPHVPMRPPFIMQS
jgi:hypothetical protein